MSLISGDRPQFWWPVPGYSCRSPWPWPESASNSIGYQTWVILQLLDRLRLRKLWRNNKYLCYNYTHLKKKNVVAATIPLKLLLVLSETSNVLYRRTLCSSSGL